MNTLRLHIGRNSLVLYIFIAAVLPISWAQCKVPQCKKGLIVEESAKAVTMNISIPVDDFAPRNLVCLAEHFQKQYPGRQEIVITIFDSQDAAQHSRPMIEVRPDFAAWLSHQHAYYYYDQSKKDNYLQLLPDANNRGLEQNDVTGRFCTKWNERESTWRKSGHADEEVQARANRDDAAAN